MVASKKPITDSLKNDYEAVDIAVQEISATHQAENRILRGQAWRRFFKWAAIFSIVLAISLYIIMRGYWSLNKPYPKETVIEQQIVNETLKEKYNSHKVVENYSKFTYIQTEFEHLSGVVIGRKYKNQNYSEPQSQWCYIERRVDEAQRDTLYIRDDAGYKSPNISTLKKFNLTQNDFNKLKSYCVFD